jgi:hypothetical protein
MALPDLQFLLQHYAAGGVEDFRACEMFIECENRERLNPLRSQLRSISSGAIEDDVLHKIVGKGRAMKHGSYSAWARLMLQWLNKTGS